MSPQAAATVREAQRIVSQNAAQPVRARRELDRTAPPTAASGVDALVNYAELMADAASCRDCAFHFRLRSREVSQCRRRAPVAHSTRAGVETVWPEVSPQGWCGEWAAR